MNFNLDFIMSKKVFYVRENILKRVFTKNVFTNIIDKILTMN